MNWEEKVDLFGESIVSPIASILFWPVPGLNALVVAWSGVERFFSQLK